ncbi:Exocyst complex component sec6 [Fulvia fulva]|uniref:Exocyst complex component sec6 n=1 Tax=Passalora fulva TaxID=5499 RepID=A0A9Q8L5P0_PASFU|nr:Exocyst complex component sec6 [Fulvia fulva]KAK4634542.1 Exocyst complex component sec6 [Fulvia fulva]KAK4636634.1 Exocyst complex component sec6 [Fulvia fulva]UJO11360.1 Exocyst complex component sec6 [Fulvia fulva]WPV09950.1 Exocyst complex component sec6 [Fulvia fulva]WPV24678.1 Exocyst complex component sec6 [Fulvia fulva]
MNDGSLEDTTSKLAELLKNPDDLDKLPSLRGEFTRKKAAIDGQLKHGLKEQLEITQNGMTSINEGQKIVGLIKEEMMKIDKLCAEAQGMIEDFPEINKMSVMQRNFAAVESVKASIDTFGQQLSELEALLKEDEEDMDNQPNLLAVHAGLTGLRDVRDQAMDQVKGSADGESGLELIENLPLEGGVTLRDHFARLDDVVDWFDEHVGTACINIISIVQAGNNGLVVRLALVIEEEEKKDRQTKALQDAQREFQDVASRFKSINVGQRELRGYKKKFLQAVEASATAQFEQVKQAFDEDPEKLEKAVRWFFNDLNTVKLGLQELMPKKWKIFQTFTNIYHKLMHDFLVQRLDDKDITPVHMLAILNWVEKYYSKMTRLGMKPEELRPHVIDERETELVREYRSLITRAVEEWMDRMAASDRKTFLSRTEGSLDQDADDQLHTKSLSDMWTMLREQLAVAQSSGRPDVVEGVVDAMIRALKGRQQMWERLVDDEYRKVEMAQDTSALEGVGTLQEWLVAIANDQITNIDDDPEHNAMSFLTRFKADFEPLVTPSYAITSSTEIEHLTNGYVDLATHCMSLFAAIIFATDIKPVLSEFFTQSWYQKKTMASITTTFEDYLKDFTGILHPSLQDIFIEELADALLQRYLECVKNKGVKFRRQDPFTEKIKDDVVTVFNFFSQHGAAFDLVKDKWRAVNSFENILSAPKGPGVVEAFERMKTGYWDVQIGWVEAVLRSRDDFDRGMLSSIKNTAANMSVERGPETVLGKVK